MNIAAIAAFACGKLSKTDTPNVTFCKSAIRVRWESVWDSRLWRASMIPEVVTVTAGTTMLTMPVGIDRVIALRYGPRTVLDPANWESLLKDDPTAFERVGQPWKFIQAGRNASGQVLVRLIGTPTTDESMLVIGKAPFPACAADADSPSAYLDGVDAVLLAFAEGDMLEKMERRQAAISKFTEATTLMATMESLQNDQSGQTYEVQASPIQLQHTDW